MKSRAERRAAVELAMLTLSEAMHDDLEGIVVITKWGDGFGLISARAKGRGTAAEDTCVLKLQACLTLHDNLRAENAA